MSGVYHIDIKENAEQLKQMLTEQKVACIKEKVQAIYLLKTGNCQTVTKTAQILGRNRKGSTAVALRISESGNRRITPTEAFDRQTKSNSALGSNSTI